LKSANEKKTVFQARFEPTLAFHDLMYQVAGKLHGDYKHWSTTGREVKLRDTEHKCSVRLSSRDFALEFDGLQRSDHIETRIWKAHTAVRDGLQFTTYKRIGFRRYSVYDQGMTFEECSAVLNERFFSDRVLLEKLLSPNMIDMAFVVVFEDASFRYNLNVGPVTREEAVRLVALNVSDHVEGKDAPQAITAWEEGFPDVGVLIDLDVFKQDVPCSEAKDVFESAYSAEKSMRDRIRQYISEGRV